MGNDEVNFGIFQRHRMKIQRVSVKKICSGPNVQSEMNHHRNLIFFHHRIDFFRLRIVDMEEVIDRIEFYPFQTCLKILLQDLIGIFLSGINAGKSNESITDLAQSNHFLEIMSKGEKNPPFYLVTVKFREPLFDCGMKIE